MKLQNIVRITEFNDRVHPAEHFKKRPEKTDRGRTGGRPGVARGPKLEVTNNDKTAEPRRVCGPRKRDVSSRFLRNWHSHLPDFLFCAGYNLSWHSGSDRKGTITDSSDSAVRLFWCVFRLLSGQVPILTQTI